MPIVRSRADALALFHRSRLHCLVVDDEILLRNDELGSVRCGHPDVIELLLLVDSPDHTDCSASHAAQVERVRLVADDADGGPLSGDFPALAPDVPVTVLIPVWAELLAETMPRLLRWLLTCRRERGNPVAVLDPRGRRVPLESLVDGRRSGLGGLGSLVEEHWLQRVATWPI
jgi:hypothetical protein